ncbi:unnamed protein product [Pieris brassicae]|uniref:Uncharacterized protein n=1 Tax=Pieris brassicae TaxID=7116 RepID=A0A9P0TPC5_PIEBR|nr:unnamed protein product [Pieris brassicae]
MRMLVSMDGQKRSSHSKILSLCWLLIDASVRPAFPALSLVVSLMHVGLVDFWLHNFHTKEWGLDGMVNSYLVTNLLWSFGMKSRTCIFQCHCQFLQAFAALGCEPCFYGGYEGVVGRRTPPLRRHVA